MAVRVIARWSMVLVSLVLAATASGQRREIRVPPRSASASAAELRARVRSLAVPIRSLAVNGRLLEADRIRREAVYLFGASVVQAQVLTMRCRPHIAQAMASGRSAAELWPTDAELAAEPEVGSGRQVAPFVRRAHRLVDRVFLHGPPRSWPEVTREILLESAGGERPQDFWEGIAEHSEIPPFWREILHGFVTRGLERRGDVDYPSDGLPASVCVRVDGADWPVAEAFAEIRAGLCRDELELAAVSAVAREALRQELVRRHGWRVAELDAWIAFQDTIAADAFARPIAAPPVPHGPSGYPSADIRRQYLRLWRGFALLRTEERRPLRDELEVDVDVIQFLAERGGRHAARERATAARRALDAGADFDRLCAERHESPPDADRCGRLLRFRVAGLRTMMCESTLTDVVFGGSLARYLAVRAPPGSVVGPLPGPAGYYLARVAGRRGRLAADPHEAFSCQVDEVLARCRVEPTGTGPR